jgi:ATP-dependent Lhr-like helicase
VARAGATSRGAVPSTAVFDPAVAAWFERRFAAPTAAQARAWPAIARGEDALVAAPTGSGKTLAAFLFCLDRLVREARAGELPDATEVVYVSPLKALSNDVHKNLERPLAEIAAVAEQLGAPFPAIRAAVRTGDTSAADRRAAVKRPPHVLVTTPESLFILLTSTSGRKALAAVRTVVVDEIHALAADKRGAHLALSLERLDDLVTGAGRPRPQRVGLSATVRPIEVAARLLVGAGRALPEVVDVGLRRDLDLAIEVPKDELGAVCTNEQWIEVYDRLAELAREHRSTLVFVNTRKLVERVSLHLAERLGEEHVAAHHGSMSRARRHEAERRLKEGQLRVVVATASLELGIDVGDVELACLVGSPRSVSTAVQRIGRSGHVVGGTPKGRLFPLTRDQLVECAAIVRAARAGTMDAIALRDAPLDVLAQQLVAEVASQDRGVVELFDAFRRAAPYASLRREDWDAVVAMLSEGIATRRGRAGALVHHDMVGERLRGRRGARLAAVTSGGAIPDNANYDVLLAPEGTKVGTLDEDFAVESMAGDVFLLGNTSWRIRRIEGGKVWVEDARGQAPGIPFWLGEGPARTRELSAEVARLREDVSTRVPEKPTPAHLDAAARFLEGACALDRRGADLLRDYVIAGRSALGAVPTEACVVLERFFDESGGMQLALHAPFGGRINRAWGMALRKRFCRTFDFELQAAATDDGVLLSLGAQHSFPLESIFELLDPEGLDEVLVQAALQAPMFATRWRWNATRALALLRFQGGRKVPPPLQRMRAEDLLAAVFPMAQSCQDNHGPWTPIEPPEHPLVDETLRDCLVEAMDVEGLRRVLQGLASGAIRRVARETPEPSVFCHEILNANPYAFLDDAPLEERRARAVSVRRGLPSDVAAEVGALDADAIAGVCADAWPDARDADELADALVELGAMLEREGERAGFAPLFQALAGARRAARVEPRAGTALWIAAEKRRLADLAWPGARVSPDVAVPAAARGRVADREDAVLELVRGSLAILGPVTAAALAERLALDVGDVEIALARAEGDGVALRGRFTPGLAAAADVEWCDRRLLARIHRRTVDRLRREIEPATPAELLRFLFVWHGVRPSSRAHGQAGLARVVSRLQGFELAAGAWESHVLAARVAKYDPAWLDALCLSGEVAWGRLAPRDGGSAPTRAAPITLALRRDLGWLLAPRDEPPADGLSHAARDVLAWLERAGASFFDEIVRGARRLPAEVEDALWELVAAGRVTGDGFAGLRYLLTPAHKRGGGPRRRRATPSHRRAPILAAGRWSLLRAPIVFDDDPAPPPGEASPALEALAKQYVLRWGVVFRDVLAREPGAPPWRDLLRVYRRMELRGELRGGRLVAGFVGEQFASPEALEALRAVRREPARGEIVRLSACDPLNLVGVITPGARVAATLGHEVAYVDGVPIDPKDARRAESRAAAPP